MSVENITKGDIVFNEHGQKFVFIAEADGDYIVRPTVEIDEDEPWEGSPVTLRKVFASAPREMYDKNIEALDKKIYELNEQKRALEDELRRSKQDETERKKRIMVNAALERIDDFLAGNIKYIVFGEYDVRIEPFDQAMRYKDNDYEKVPSQIKLLSLFGDTKGDLAWKLNRYSDGSGSGNDAVHPCVTLEQAQETAKALIDSKFEEWRKGKINYWGLGSMAASAIRLGLPIPEDVYAAVKAENLKNATTHRDAKKKEYDDAEAKLSDTLNKSIEELVKGKR